MSSPESRYCQHFISLISDDSSCSSIISISYDYGNSFIRIYIRIDYKNYWIILNLQISTLSQTSSLDFSTFYTTIPHQKLKSRLATIIRNSFFYKIRNSFLHKNGNRRYKYLVLGREGPYFVKEHSNSKNNYTEEDIKMLEFLVNNIFVVFAGNVFQQIIGIPMGTNCTPLLADIFLYSYEAEFIQSLLSTGRKRLAFHFNFTYRYIDDVLSINNPDFENCRSDVSLWSWDQRHDGEQHVCFLLGFTTVNR